MSALASLFPAGEHRFHLTLGRCAPEAFFRPTDLSGTVCAERARWLATPGPRYTAFTALGETLWAEVASALAAWDALPADIVASDTHQDPRVIGAHVEPDLLVLSRSPSGPPALEGGVLCFPTGWALEEKLGRPLGVIHDVVPGLQPALGPAIERFFTHLRPGAAFLRDNWGLAASPELNAHPARQLPPPRPPVALAALWLRVEHQALVALPQTGGVLFGIRIALHRLDTVAADPAARNGLAHALRTMPEPLARYKNIAAIRGELAALLD